MRPLFAFLVFLTCVCQLHAVPLNHLQRSLSPSRPPLEPTHDEIMQVFTEHASQTDQPVQWFTTLRSQVTRSAFRAIQSPMIASRLAKFFFNVDTETPRIVTSTPTESVATSTASTGKQMTPFTWKNRFVHNYGSVFSMFGIYFLAFRHAHAGESACRSRPVQQKMLCRLRTYTEVDVVLRVYWASMVAYNMAIPDLLNTMQNHRKYTALTSDGQALLFKCFSPSGKDITHEVHDSFKDSSWAEVTFPDDLLLFRTSGPSKHGPHGRYWAPLLPSTLNQLRDDLAILTDWGDLTALHVVRLPAQTRVSFGQTAPQVSRDESESREGGAPQVAFSDQQVELYLGSAEKPGKLSILTFSDDILTKLVSDPELDFKTVSNNIKDEINSVLEKKLN